ncbi:MAG: hypothetical protein ACFFG0_23565 [Candidatus Thorarchaeota archaeon]
MTSEKSNIPDKKLDIFLEPGYKNIRLKRFIIYYLKRIFNYLTIFHGILTIIFLFQYSQTDNRRSVIEFYLFSSIILFVIYGFLILASHFLSKSYYSTIIQESKEPIKLLKKVKKEITETSIEGKALQVYWYLYSHNHASIREMQKALNFSSSGTVAYQITKLLNDGIISKSHEEGKYIINKEIKIGILKFFVRIGTRVIPRISFYLIIYILGFVIYSILALLYGNKFITEPLSFLLLFFLITGTIILIFESIKIWKLNPNK